MNFAKDARGPTSLTVDSVVAQQRATAIEMQREWLRMEKVREEEAELQARHYLSCIEMTHLASSE